MHPSLIRQAYSANQIATRMQFDSYRRRHNLIQDYNRRQQFIPAYVANVIIYKLDNEIKTMLGISSTAIDLILPTQGKHIRERRGKEAKQIISSIAKALEEIKYYGRRLDEKVHTVIGTHKGRLLLVGIKFIPAEKAKSGMDEALITTSYFLNEKRLKEMLNKNNVKPILKF